MTTSLGLNISKKLIKAQGEKLLWKMKWEKEAGFCFNIDQIVNYP